MPRLNSIDHIVLTVSDLARTCAFYADILGMETRVFTAADGTERHALYFGAQKINLHLAGREFDPKAASPVPGSADLCFLSDAPLALWLAHLEQHGTRIEEGPVRRSGALEPILSIYLRDPDGNLVEIAERVGSAG